MRINVFSFLLACLFFGNPLLAQDDSEIESNEATLLQLSTTVLKDSLKENRITAEDSFKKLLASTLKEENSFHYSFENLQTVSILYPADSTFRIFTWQLYVDKSDYRYGGLIQMNKEENQIFPLTDQSAEIATYDIEFDVLEADSWYGSIYFNLQEFDSKEGKKYLLFGFDGFEFFNKRKVLDVLSFDEEGQPVFGAPAFAKVEEGYEASTKNRLYIEYSAEVAAKLNFDPNLEMIMIDHMVAMKGRYKGQGNVNIPDGSYEGYKLNNGIWEHQEKIFDLVSEKPPAPNPILENRKDNQKDMFGQPKRVATKKMKKKKKKG